MFGGVKHDLQDFMLRAEGKDVSKYWGMYTQNVESAYSAALLEFEKKKLIEFYTAGNACTYPKITGYNYFNDPQFYVAYRKKGEDSWNGRLSVPLDISHLTRHLNAGYEFREKEVIYSNLN
jgi:hypothetical protein